MFQIHGNTDCSVQEAAEQLPTEKTYVKSDIKLDPDQDVFLVCVIQPASFSLCHLFNVALILYKRKYSFVPYPFIWFIAALPNWWDKDKIYDVSVQLDSIITPV